MRFRLRLLRASLLVAFIWVVPVIVEAQAQRDRQVELARDHMEQGQEHYVQGQFAEAAAEFQLAYEAQPFSAFLYNAGVAYERLGQSSRAADYFARYLEQEPRAPDAQDVRSRVDRLRTQALETPGTTTTTVPPPVDATTTVDGGVAPGDPGATVGTSQTADAGAATVTAPTDTAPAAMTGPADFKSLLSVQTEPVGVQVQLRSGGRIVAEGPSPLAVTVEEGTYTLRLSHPDYRAREREFAIRAGRVVYVIVEMSQGDFLGYLDIRSSVPGANVFIDDRSVGAVGQTPYQRTATVGRHRVWIERPGYEVIEREVDVEIGETVEIEVPLTRVTYGQLRVIANVPGAEVYVDDERVGVVPFEGHVRPGPHEVRVEGDDSKDWEGEVTIAAGQVTPIRVRLRPSVGRGGAWVTGTLAALCFGGAVVTGLIANGIEEDVRVDREAGRLASDDSRLEEGKILALSADIALGLGAVLAGFSIYYFLRDPLPDSEATVLRPRDWAFAPYVTPEGAGGFFRWAL